jgi:signal transduction histidine kinase
MKTNILVIEDEEDLRTSIAEMLEFEGIACVVAQNGKVGIQLARNILPDLIICDIMMPDMDGYAVLSDLRSDPLTANIPFIFLTAKADRSSLRYGMELGADDYLTKPFTSDELMAAINMRLEKKASFVREYTRQADDLRHALIHSLPHELRTPLAGILGGAEMLLSDSIVVADEELVGLARMVLDCGKRLQRQVENYLFYAQLQIIRFDKARLATLETARTDGAGTLIRDIAESKAVSLDRRSDLVLNVKDGTVLIAAENLAKLVEEIVDNAFKFSNPGSRVSVSAAIKEDDYVLSVSDNGRGMSVEQIKNVGALMQFGRKLYEQQGAGLGLAIVKLLIELHGGELSIQSESDRGTRVRAKLPRTALD